MSIAFFDVDGTLLPLPSLERRLVWNLLQQGKIPVANCLRWIGRMARFTTSNPLASIQSNKMYLRKVREALLSETGLQYGAWIPEFFPAAIQRVWWHAARGDEIVLITGTLAPIAEIVKIALERELLWRGVESHITAFATWLEARAGLYTGEVDGTPMFGEAKAVAIKQFACARDIPVSQCFAYGDHRLDASMLASIGNPIAVNPDSQLRRASQRNGWPVAHWIECPPRRGARHLALKWKGEVAR